MFGNILKSRIFYFIIFLGGIFLIFIAFYFDFLMGSFKFGIFGSSLILFGILVIIFSIFNYIYIDNFSNLKEEVYFYYKENKYIIFVSVLFLIIFVLISFLINIFEYWYLYYMIPVFPFHLILFFCRYILRISNELSYLISLIIGLPITIKIWHYLIMRILQNNREKFQNLRKLKSKNK